jgi:hypothetical protein
MLITESLFFFVFSFFDDDEQCVATAIAQRINEWNTKWRFNDKIVVLLCCARRFIFNENVIQQLKCFKQQRQQHREHISCVGCVHVNSRFSFFTTTTSRPPNVYKNKKNFNSQTKKPVEFVNEKLKVGKANINEPSFLLFLLVQHSDGSRGKYFCVFSHFFFLFIDCVNISISCHKIRFFFVR